MKLTLVAVLGFTSVLAVALDSEIPKTIAASVGDSLHWTEDQFLAAAEAMPDSKYDFIPRRAISKECAHSANR
jgi:hypothetical protein